MMARRALPLLAALALAGCAVGPNYRMPSLHAPSSWFGLGGNTAEGTAPVGNLAWWKAFGDPTLDALITQAVHANADLKIARARLAEARAGRLAANAALLPGVDGNAAVSRGKSTSSAKTATTSSADFAAGWELDLFGGNRRAAEAASYAVQSAEASRKNVLVSLLAETTRNYLAVRALRQQAQLTQDNLDLQRETERIVTAQRNEGVVSDFDLARARAQRAATQTQLPVVAQQLAAATNNLAVLVGLNPADIRPLLAPVSGTADAVPVAAPQVLVDTPASVLAARPDVRVAERNLAEATANQGVAIANWFPKLSVSALFGVADSSLAGGGAIWSAGGSALVPLLDFGRVRALVKTADARQQAALAAYEQTVRAALADVETALSGYLNAQAQLASATEAAEASRKATSLAQLRYKEGTSSLLDLLSTQAQQLTADVTLANARATQGQALANLYTALGGGAETAPPAAR